MKNKPFELYNQPDTKSVFFHEHILDCLSIPVLVTNKNDHIIYVNKKFNDLFQSNSSLRNRSMKEIVNREDWNNWNENLFKLSNLNDDKNCNFNIRLNSSNECIKYLKLEGKVFQRDERHRPALYFFSAEELTGNIEEQNTFLNSDDIKENSENFTAKTSAEKKLELAVKDLDRSNKELEEFAYIASHDLQEPLRKITVFSGKLALKLNEKLGEEGKFYISKINAAAGSMKQLIENILQISRTVKYNQPFILTDLNDVLNQAKQNLDLKIEEGKTHIIQDNLPVIEALPTLLLQLFDNLLNNAIKFSSKNQTATINIHSREISNREKENLRLPADKIFYEIKIKDNGIGFKQEYAKNIFKTFYRLNGKTEYPGTGIGLSICAKIVERHNGLIWAESEPEKGASFFIILPKIQDALS